MLKLTRRTGESILIGDDIIVTVLKIKGISQVSIGIEAPKHVRVDREEVAERIEAERIEAHLKRDA